MGKFDTAKIDSEFIKELRSSLGMTQAEFWGTFGLTQACGSYYESGKTKVKPHMQQLIYMQFIKGKRIPKIQTKG